jgi:GTP cyclohydrolase II
MFRAIGYASRDEDPATVALIHGDPAGRARPLVHVHVACRFGDAFRSLLCDCRTELDEAARAIVRDGAGVIIYARPRVPAAVVCVRDEPVDAEVVAGILRAEGVSSFRLLDDGRGTRLREELRGCGLKVAG